MSVAIHYFIVLVSLVAIDGTWLTLTGKSFYAKQLAHLFGNGFMWQPAAVFYTLYAAGVVFFVVEPALRMNQSIGKTFLVGAFLGLLAYAAYDLTNHATLRDWPLVVTLVDMAWGATVTGLASAIAVAIIKHLS